MCGAVVKVVVTCIPGSHIVIFCCVYSSLVSVIGVCNPQVSTDLLLLQCCFSFQETVQVVLYAKGRCFGSSKAPLFLTLLEPFLLLPEK